VSELGDAIEALRTAVMSGDQGPDALRSAGSPVLVEHEVAWLPGGEVDTVIVRPRGSVRLSELERELGPARPLPRRPSGGSTRTVIFDRTLPEEGTAGATVLAEVDDDGVVVSVIVRLDRY
jgi:hypothetical protein